MSKSREGRSASFSLKSNILEMGSNSMFCVPCEVFALFAVKKNRKGRKGKKSHYHLAEELSLSGSLE